MDRRAGRRQGNGGSRRFVSPSLLFLLSLTRRCHRRRRWSECICTRPRGAVSSPAGHARESQVARSDVPRAGRERDCTPAAGVGRHGRGGRAHRMVLPAARAHTSQSSGTALASSAHTCMCECVYLRCSVNDFAGELRTGPITRFARCHRLVGVRCLFCLPSACRLIVALTVLRLRFLLRRSGRPDFGSVAVVGVSNRVTPDEQFKKGRHSNTATAQSRPENQPGRERDKRSARCSLVCECVLCGLCRRLVEVTQSVCDACARE